MAQAPVTITATAEQAALLTAAGFVALAPPGEPVTYWNPPGGSAAISTTAALAQVVEFFNTGRKALLTKHFLQTSEFWMAASGPMLAAPVGIASLAGFADHLGPPWSAVITGFCGFVTVAGPAAYRVARYIAKYYAAKEGKALPPDQGAPSVAIQ